MRKQFIKQFYKDNHLLFMLSFMMIMCLASVNLIISYLLQQLTDIAMGQVVGPLITMIKYCGLVILVFIVLSIVKRYTYSKFVAKAMIQYRGFIFSELTKKSMHSFAGESTSKYISALTNDAITIEENYLTSVFSFVVQVIGFVGAFVMMIIYSPVLTGAAVILSIVPIVASIMCSGKLVKAEKAVSDANEAYVGTVKDILTGFSVVKSFKAEQEIEGLYGGTNKILGEAKYHKRMTEELINIIGVTASIVAQLGVFIIGAYLAVTGHDITPGVVIVFVQLMYFVVEPIGKIPALLGNRRAAKGLIDKMVEALSENVRDEGITLHHELKEGIIVEQLDFAYDEEKTVLNNINYTFERGKSYAIVGGSGSGKSTLLHLLMGSFANYNGSIRLDGQELKTIRTDSLYELMTIIQQNVFVFNSSIRDNITMFKHFDEGKINAAIQQSGLEQLILEKGVGYVCGENGCHLSGGEKQRIAIARSLLQDTSILLVDEATAALDQATAHAVTTAILAIENLIRIVVTHSLEACLLRQYDQILVLKNGVLCEVGTFEQLIARKDYFYSLYNVTQ